jgi:hypothetical protein
VSSEALVTRTCSATPTGALSTPFQYRSCPVVIDKAASHQRGHPDHPSIYRFAQACWLRDPLSGSPTQRDCAAAGSMYVDPVIARLQPAPPEYPESPGKPAGESLTWVRLRVAACASRTQFAAT